MYVRVLYFLLILYITVTFRYHFTRPYPSLSYCVRPTVDATFNSPISAAYFTAFAAANIAAYCAAKQATVVPTHISTIAAAIDAAVRYALS